MCWVQIIIAIVIAIIGEAIRPKQKSNTGRPAGLGDFQFPTAEAGRVIPWLAGTAKVLGPNTTASGQFYTAESYVRVRTGWWSTAKQSYGFRYYLSVQQVICGGVIDDVVCFQVNDKILKVKTKTITDDYIDVIVDDPAFYGDAKKDGGFFGLARVWRGTATQGIDTVLQAVLEQDEISAYRYVCYVMFRNFCFGMSNNPPPVVPVLSRWPNSLGVLDGKHIIGTTASNVICAVYDLLTDPIRCMKVPAAAVDRPAFLAAALTCFNEGIGYCGIMDGSQSGKDAIDNLMAYADGQVFKDPFTGLWTCKLARADYNIDDLIVLDESNSRVVGKSKTDWPDTKNTMTVAYVDKDKNWTNQSVTSRDSGNLEVLGQTVNAITQDMNGIDNVAQANFTAERSRAALSTPFVKMEIESQGAGSNLRINDVFLAKYPNTKRIGQMVMRVTDITYPNDSETTCNIQAVEDKFGVKFVAFTETGSGQWAPPDLTPAASASQRVDELPWAMTPGIDGGRYVMTMAARPGVVEDSYDVLNVTTSSTTNNVDAFTPVGGLATALPASGPTSGTTQGQGLRVGSLNDPSGLVSALPSEYAIGTSLIFVGDELIAFQNATDNLDGTFTLWPWTRAIYDTIPQDHLAGDKVFVISGGAGLAQDTALVADGLVNYKLLMKAGGVSVAAVDTTTLPVTVRSRAQRPYLPGAVLFGGTAIQAAPTGVAGALTLSWNSRNRLSAGVGLTDYASAPVTAETGSFYALQFFNGLDGTLLVEKLDMGGSSASAVLNYTGPVRMVFYSKTATLDSYLKYEVTFDYTPPAGTSASVITAGTYTPAVYVLDGGGA